MTGLDDVLLKITNEENCVDLLRSKSWSHDEQILIWRSVFAYPSASLLVECSHLFGVQQGLDQWNSLGEQVAHYIDGVGLMLERMSVDDLEQWKNWTQEHLLNVEINNASLCLGVAFEKGLECDTVFSEQAQIMATSYVFHKWLTNEAPETWSDTPMIQPLIRWITDPSKEDLRSEILPKSLRSAKKMMYGSSDDFAVMRAALDKKVILSQDVIVDKTQNAATKSKSKI